MWVCGQTSPHVHFLIHLAALQKTWKCSSDQNVDQLQTEVLICLSEATETTWVAFWGIALQKTLLLGSQNFSDTNHQNIWLLKGSQTHWLQDQFMTLPLWVLCGSYQWGEQWGRKSEPSSLPYALPTCSTGGFTAAAPQLRKVLGCCPRRVGRRWLWLWWSQRTAISLKGAEIIQSS